MIQMLVSVGGGEKKRGQACDFAILNQTGQLRTLAYDGHGRLQSRTTPEQGTTIFSYNVDDTTNVMTDARGAYRAFASLKGMNYANGRSLSTAYDTRLRPTTWNVASVLGYNYNYDYFNEHTGRVTYVPRSVFAEMDLSLRFGLRQI
jgi:YD repeat-containing protein